MIVAAVAAVNTKLQDCSERKVSISMVRRAPTLSGVMDGQSSVIYSSSQFVRLKRDSCHFVPLRFL